MIAARIQDANDLVVDIAAAYPVPALRPTRLEYCAIDGIVNCPRHSGQSFYASYLADDGIWVYRNDDEVIAVAPVTDGERTVTIIDVGGAEREHVVDGPLPADVDGAVLWTTSDVLDRVVYREVADEREVTTDE